MLLSVRLYLYLQCASVIFWHCSMCFIVGGTCCCSKFYLACKDFVGIFSFSLLSVHALLGTHWLLITFDLSKF